MTLSFSRPLALSQGDPAGVGPDVTLLAWMRRRELGLPPFVFIGDPDVLASRAKLLGLTIAIRETDCTNANDVFADALPVLPIAAGIDVVAGEPHVATAKSTIAAMAQRNG
jgi:4-hydroxythreonine-4-phosphate dehydrogenase